MDYGFGINTLNKRDEISQFPIVMVRLVQMAHLIRVPAIAPTRENSSELWFKFWLDLAVMFPAQYN